MWSSKRVLTNSKAISNAMKARGLTRLRWYCQVCSKACRDANGYKPHIDSEAHARQLAAAAGDSGQRAGKLIHDYSSQFQRGFITLLRSRFGTRRVLANQVYQEYIRDRHHVHMNATRWVSLGEFVGTLGRAGVVRVESSDLGLFITWIDNSESARARQDAIKKMDRAKMDDEQRSRKLLDEQVQRAREESAAHGNVDTVTEQRREEGIQRDEGAAPVKLSLALNPSSKPKDTPTTSAAPSSNLPSAPIRVNPLKVASKAAVAATTNPPAGTSTPAPKKRPPPTHVSAAERIMLEEQSRKGRAPGPMMQPGVKRSRF